MRLETKYGSTILGFTVKFRKRKTLQISIKPPSQIEVSAPLGMPVSVIQQQVQDHGDWILRKLSLVQERDKERVHHTYENGELFLYLGKSYPLQIDLQSNYQKAVVILADEKLTIHTNSHQPEDIRRVLEEWYRDQTLKLITKRVQFFSDRFSVKPRLIKVKEQKKRWASCTSRGDLLFNWRCGMAPPEVLDYIVVHEMCHLVHFNHSKDFWKLVDSILPDYEKQKGWLKQYGLRMDLS